MGFAHPNQTTAGIHTRLYSRAFIFDDGYKKFVYASIDMGMMGHLLKSYVIKELQKEFGSTFTYENVMLSGTHTHSGPAGYLQYVTYDVTSLGFVPEVFDGLVQGIADSIRRAYFNMKPARIYYTENELHDANINRSPYGYDANPQAEKDKYNYNTDHTVVQLNVFHRITDEPLGLINFFAVHPVSMNYTNALISSDNKGTASLLVEQYINGDETPVGKGPFIAAFGSSNLGDVSPNLNGPKCIDSGLDCDYQHSTCEGFNEMCQANGPGNNTFESTFIIGERQANNSYTLLLNRGTELAAEVDFIYQFIDMTNYTVQHPNGSMSHTCPPALGYGFAAGCTDGPGAFNFQQAENSTNPFWDFVVDHLAPPTPEQEACHFPKPILLDTGEVTRPYLWHPNTIDTQVAKLGDLIIMGAPGEFATMAGRRMRDTLYQTATANGASPATKVVIAGLSNVYSHYITTFEEYQHQRYEAASTLFGPLTLSAYQAQYAYLVANMLQKQPVPIGEYPPDLLDEQVGFLHDPAPDVRYKGYEFGTVLIDANARQG